MLPATACVLLATTMRASTDTAPFSSTMMGLMSISRSSGSSHTISDTRSSTSSSASMSTAWAPRHSPSVCATRERSMSRRARNWLSGGSSMARSFSSSIMVPPAPNTMTGPKGSSVTMPT